MLIATSSLSYVLAWIYESGFHRLPDMIWIASVACPGFSTNYPILAERINQNNFVLDFEFVLSRELVLTRSISCISCRGLLHRVDRANMSAATREDVTRVFADLFGSDNKLLDECTCSRSESLRLPLHR